MTDQKPDRQGGDGLLPCPFCNKAVPSVGCVTGFRRFAGEQQTVSRIECICGAQGPVAVGTLTLQADAQRAWNTRAPTRDGAEGAGDDLPLDAEHPINYRKAFAKPAPDAMRGAFEAWALLDHRGVQPLEGEERIDTNNHDTDNEAFIGWKAALIAALSDQPKEPLGIVRRIGWIRNKDIDPGADDDAGRFLGVVIEYPNGPPSFSPRVVWDKTPVRIVIGATPSSTAGEGK